MSWNGARFGLTRRGFLRRGFGFSAMAPASAVAASAGDAAQTLKPNQALPSLRPRVTPIPNEEYLARQEKARELMAAARLDAVLLMGGSSLLYFTGVTWGRSERVFAAVLPRRGELACVCPAFERQRAEEQIRFPDSTGAGGKDLRTWEEDQSPYRLLRQVLRDRGVRRLGMEETLPYFVVAGLAREAPAIAQAPADPVTAGCRMVKSPREIGRAHV